MYALVCPGDTNSRFHCVKVYDKRTIKIEEGVKYNNDYLGVDVDIFAIDGSDVSQENYERDRKRVNQLYKASCTIKCGLVGSIKRRARVCLYKLIYGDPDKLMQKAITICEKNKYEDSKFVARYGRFGLGYRVEKSCYEVSSAEFEGELFPIPSGYDQVLSAQYGDYMKLPPIEKQVTHHRNNVFWKRDFS